MKDIWFEPSQGFGDTFYKIADTLYIPHCFGCIKRRRKWNKKLNYKKQRSRVYLVVVYKYNEKDSKILTWFNNEQDACNYIEKLDIKCNYDFVSVSEMKEGEGMGVFKQWYNCLNGSVKEVHPKDVSHLVPEIFLREGK